MADEPVSIVVAESDAGKRLDAALAGLLPGMGLRGRRRACELGRAQVNGRARPAAYRTRPGDVLTLAARKEGGDGAFLSRAVAPVLTPEKAEAGGLAALFKPAGMHCAALAGKPGICLGDLLAGLPGSARLLNRLDCATSGIVMAALDAEGERRWKEAQDGGLTRKHYLALLQGRLDGGRMVKQRLILKGRERVLVEMADHPDSRRHTLIVPLARIAPECLRNRTMWEGEATLAGCMILKGARHQIRAHAAALGHPLLGDTRYGAEGRPAAEERFFLHHGRVELPGFTASCLPDWLEALGEEARCAGEAWLAGESFGPGGSTCYATD